MPAIYEKLFFSLIQHTQPVNFNILNCTLKLVLQVLLLLLLLLLPWLLFTCSTDMEKNPTHNSLLPTLVSSSCFFVEWLHFSEERKIGVLRNFDVCKCFLHLESFCMWIDILNILWSMDRFIDRRIPHTWFQCHRPKSLTPPKTHTFCWLRIITNWPKRTAATRFHSNRNLWSQLKWRKLNEKKISVTVHWLWPNWNRLCMCRCLCSR